MHVLSRFLLLAVITVALASCDNPTPPSLFQWKSYINKLSMDYYPTRIADSLGWSGRAVGQIDFLVTDGNYFAAVICYESGSTGYNSAFFGKYTGKELQFKSFGYDRGSGTVTMDEYKRRRENDSLWWLVADSDFWAAAPVPWEEALHDNAWLYHRYGLPTQWIAYDRVSPASHTEPEVPIRADYWKLDVTFLARKVTDSLFGEVPGFHYYSHLVNVDFLSCKGHYFCAIVSYQKRDSLIYRGIVGLHDGRGISFRRVSIGPTTVVGSEIAHYYDLKASDSLWKLEFSETVVQNQESLEDFFWSRSVDYRIKSKFPVMRIEL